MSIVDSPPPSGSLMGRLKLIRLISVIVTVSAVVALGFMAAAGSGPKASHLAATKRSSAVAKRTSGHLAAPSTPTVAPTPASGAGSIIGSAPLAAPVTSPAVAPAQFIPAATASTSPTVTSTPPTTTVGTAGGAPAAAVLPACPLPLPAATVHGGLQSLIAFAPLFGPFSAEAFASAAAFQPVLQLLGPLLVAFASQYTSVQPELTPLINQVENLENEGFTAISPLYLPYRSQFLSAETQLATAVAPFAQTLGSSSAAACVVDIESALTAGAAG
jgi:hypothetical protein